MPTRCRSDAGFYVCLPYFSLGLPQLKRYSHATKPQETKDPVVYLHDEYVVHLNRTVKKHAVYS